MKHDKIVFSLLAILVLLGLSGSAFAQKVFLNPSDQIHNSVAGGGNEAEFALICANKAKALLDAAGFTTRVDQSFENAPGNANSWGADVFVSIHTNAGGGHGPESLYKSDSTLAGNLQAGLVSQMSYKSRGLKPRSDLRVLNNTSMPATLIESIFHDCSTASGIQGHPPSESAFLKSEDGQNRIARGILTGVCKHFNKSCSAGTVPTTGWYRGAVYTGSDINDKSKRLPGATVQVEGGASMVAGAEGLFGFELKPGNYTVTATHPGYKKNSSTREVTSGADIWGSISLEPDTSPAQPESDQEPSVVEPVPDAATHDVTIDAPGRADVVDAVSEIIMIDVKQNDVGGQESGFDLPWIEDETGCGCTVPKSNSRPFAIAALIVALSMSVVRRRARQTR